MNLDFSNHHETQDMIKIIEADKNLTAADAIEFSINENIYKRIIDTGWASIALSMWGHAEPDRKWSVLESPHLEIEIDEEKEQLINKVIKKERVDLETAISYFILFTMDSMGYHI